MEVKKGHGFKIITLIAAIIGISAFITGIEHCDGFIEFFGFSKSSESQPSNKIGPEKDVITEREKINKPEKSKWDVESRWDFDSGELIGLTLRNVHLINTPFGRGKCLKFENSGSEVLCDLRFDKFCIPCEISFNIFIRYGIFKIAFHNELNWESIWISRDKISVYEDETYPESRYGRLRFSTEFKHEVMKKWEIHVSKLGVVVVFIEGDKVFEFQLRRFADDAIILFTPPGNTKIFVLFDNLSLKCYLDE